MSSGRRIDRYEIRGSLGRGASGAVFLAYDPILQREVALKLLHRNDPKSLARFEREQQACTQLRHPNLAAVHATGTTQGLPYIVMELVPGQTLKDLIATSGVPAPGRSVAILRDVARAIAYAHGEGVLHRDLKPGNIVLDEDGAPRVIDFGLASLRESTSLTQTGALLGTPSYMSPEQAAGLHADAQSDVYGLGATLYHLLTGRPPFVESPLMAVHRRDPDPPSVHNPAVSPALDAVCARALARDPADRYPDADALADDLEDVLLGEAAPPSPARLWWPLALGGAALLLGGIGLAAAQRASTPDSSVSPATTPSRPTAGAATPSPVEPLLQTAWAKSRARLPYPEVRDLLASAARAARGDPKREVEVLLEQARLAWRRLQLTDLDRHLTALRRRAGPHQAEAFYLSVLVAIRRDRPGDALAFLQSAPTGTGVWAELLPALRARSIADHATTEVRARRALVRFDRHPAALFLLALALRDLRRPEEAEAILETLCAAVAPDDVNAHLALLSVERLTHGNDAASRERTRELTTRAWSLAAPERAAYLIQSCAPVALELGRPRVALRYLDHAPETGPGTPKFLILRGVAHDSLRQPDAARKAWREAYRIDPRLMRAALPNMKPVPLRLRVRRALRLPPPSVELGPKARGLIQGILKSAPGGELPTFRKLLELTLLGNPVERLNPLIEELGQGDHWVSFWIGVILGGRDDLKRSVEYLSRSLRLRWTPEAALTLGLNLLRRGPEFRSRGLQVLREVARRKQASPTVLCARATLRRFRGDVQGAIKLCDHAIRRRPNHAQSLLLRAHLEADRGRLAEGYRWLERAVRSAGFLDLHPASQLAQARIERAAEQGGTYEQLRAALSLAEGIMAASRSPRLRLAAAKSAILLPPKSAWGIAAWDWLWEAGHYPHPQVRPVLPLAKALYLLRRAQGGEPIQRGRVDALLNRAIAQQQQVPPPGLNAYRRVFGAPFRPK